MLREGEAVLIGEAMEGGGAGGQTGTTGGLSRRARARASPSTCEAGRTVAGLEANKVACRAIEGWEACKGSKAYWRL